MNKKILTLDEFMVKIENFKKNAPVDLSIAEDLSLAVMNLISLEEHFFFPALKTKDDSYFDSSLEIREMRKKLLAELVPNHLGETWCISKHLLGGTMRLIEVGNKFYSEGNKEKAKNMFEQAYKIYSIFWALKLKLITGEKIKNTAKEDLPFDDLVNKLVHCCDE